MNNQLVSRTDAVPYQEFARLIGKTPAAVKGMIEKGKLPVGLKDRPNAHAKDVQYAERQLLGLSREHEQFVEMLVIGYLKKFH